MSLLQRVQAVNGIRPVLFIGIGGAFFPEVRAAVMSTRPSPPSNANIEEYLELYLHPLCSYGVHEHNFAFIFGFTYFPSGVPCLRMSPISLPFYCVAKISVQIHIPHPVFGRYVDLEISKTLLLLII